MAKVINNTFVVTNKVRTSYANLIDARPQMNGGEPVYSCCFIIPKDDTETVESIREACNNAAKSGLGKAFGASMPKNMRFPLRDGDEDRSGDENYKNCYFINAKSKVKPKVVDMDKHYLESPDDVYSGMYVNAVLSFYPYNTNGNKGIGCGLGNMQKVEDGERFSGGMPSVDSAFTFTGESNGLPF